MNVNNFLFELALYARISRSRRLNSDQSGKVQRRERDDSGKTNRDAGITYFDYPVYSDETLSSYTSSVVQHTITDTPIIRCTSAFPICIVTICMI